VHHIVFSFSSFGSRGMWCEFCLREMLVQSEGTRPRSEGGQQTSRPRSECSSETSTPVEPSAINRGATLPVTARPPKYPDTHRHKYGCSCSCSVSGNVTTDQSVFCY